MSVIGAGEEANKMGKEKRYWLHRVSHEGGLGILQEENVLTIGFSDVAASDAAKAAIDNCDYGAFCRAYTDVYAGAIERSKNNLWRFAAEMKIGDTVIVPCPWGFYVCNITSDAVTCKREGLDLGWERKVDICGDVRSPREKYARAALLSRMKCRQTTLSIDDLKEDVESARESRPIDLVADMSKLLLAKLKAQGRPEDLEQYVAAIFRSMGADVVVLPKHYSGKTGDCDVEATFPLLRLIVSVQCKKHEGTTDDWGVKQISEYANERKGRLELGWTNWQWVVSTADNFNPSAEDAARKSNVRLIGGNEFCRMLINAGMQ